MLVDTAGALSDAQCLIGAQTAQSLLIAHRWPVLWQVSWQWGAGCVTLLKVPETVYLLKNYRDIL